MQELKERSDSRGPGKHYFLFLDQSQSPNLRSQRWAKGASTAAGRCGLAARRTSRPE